MCVCVRRQGAPISPLNRGPLQRYYATDCDACYCQLKLISNGRELL